MKEPKLIRFREKYPAYDNVPDNVLAEKVYGKYYADKLSREDFDDRFLGGPLDRSIREAAQMYDIPERRLRAVAKFESAGKQEAVSPKGARGVMQIMPGTAKGIAKELGITPEQVLNDQHWNVIGGAHYLKQQYDQFQDWEKAHAAYNAGPGRVARLKEWITELLPKETQDYITKINQEMAGAPESILDQPVNTAKSPLSERKGPTISTETKRGPTFEEVLEDQVQAGLDVQPRLTTPEWAMTGLAATMAPVNLLGMSALTGLSIPSMILGMGLTAALEKGIEKGSEYLSPGMAGELEIPLLSGMPGFEEQPPESKLETGWKKSEALGFGGSLAAAPWLFNTGPKLRRMFLPTSEELAAGKAPKLSDLVKWEAVKRAVHGTPHRMEMGAKVPTPEVPEPIMPEAVVKAPKKKVGMTIAQARKWVEENQPDVKLSALPEDILSSFPDDVQKGLLKSKRVNVLKTEAPAVEVPATSEAVEGPPTGPVKVGVSLKGDLRNEFYIEPHPDGGYMFSRKIFKNDKLANSGTIASGDWEKVKGVMDTNFGMGIAERTWEPVKEVPRREIPKMSAKANKLLDELVEQEGKAQAAVKTRVRRKAKAPAAEELGWTRASLISHMQKNGGKVPTELLNRRPDWMTLEQWERLQRVAAADQADMVARRQAELARPDLKPTDKIGTVNLSQYWDLVAAQDWTTVRREFGIARKTLGDDVVEDALIHPGKALTAVKERTGGSLRSKEIRDLLEAYRKEVVHPFRKGILPAVEPEHQVIEAFAPTAPFRRGSTESLASQEIIGRKELVDWLRERLDIPIRTGKVTRGRGKGVLGIFKVKEEVARTKYANDPETSYHEVGHNIQKFLWPEARTKKGGLSSLPFQQFKNEIYPLAYEGAKKKGVEGFAEFVRLYVTDPAFVEKKAPNFLKYFQDRLNKEAPDLLHVLDQSRSMYQKYISMSPLKRVGSLIGGSVQKTKRSPFKALYQRMVEDISPVYEGVMAMGKGVRPEAEEDAYLLMRMLPGSTGRAEAFLFHKTVDFNTLGWKGQGLKQALAGIKPSEMKDFESYCLSKSAIELWDKGIDCGITRSDAGAVVKALEGKYGEAFKGLRQFQREVLEYLKDSGVISAQHFRNLLKYRKFYIPMHRILDIEEQLMGLKAGGGKTLQAVNPIKRMKGSWLNFQDPLESVVKNTYRFVIQADRNAALQAFVTMAKNNEGWGKIIESEIPPKMIPTHVQFEEAMKALAKEMGIPKALLKEFIGEFEGVFQVFRPDRAMGKGNIIRVLWNGKPKYYQLDPEIAAVIQGMHKQELGMYGKIWKFAGIPAGMLRAGAILNPDFWARNIARDPWVAYFQAKHGFTPGVDSIKGLFSVIGKSDWYWKYKASGAEMSSLVAFDKKYLSRSAKELFGNPTYAKVMANAVRHPIEALRILTEFSENSTRTGVFRRAMEALEKRGVTGKRAMLEAGYEAREATLDFYRAGSVGVGINRLVAFWNANIQGVDKMLRTMKADPVGVGYKVFTRITIPSVALTAAQWNNPVYREIPQWQRDLFWCIAIGKDPETAIIIRIPKPFEYGILFGSMAERATQWILDRDPHAFDGLLETLGNSFNPVSWPTIIGPPLEAYINQNFFTGRPLMSEGMEKVLKGYQATPYTTRIATDIGETLGFSPTRAEHVWRGWTGGLGMYVLRAVDAIYKQINPSDIPEVGWSKHDIPLLKSFLVRFPTTDAKSIVQFYQNLEEAASRVQTINMLKDKGQEKKAERLAEEAEKTYGIKPSMVKIGRESLGVLNSYHRRMSDRWSEIRKMRYDRFMSPEQKRVTLNKIIVEMIGIAKEANHEIDEMRGHHRPFRSFSSAD